MPSLTLQDAYKLAAQHFGAGDFAQTEAICRQILSQQPDQPQVLHLLGLVAQQARRLDVALDLIGRAVAIAPQIPEFHNSFGNTLRESSQIDRAIAEFRAALQLRPDFAEAHNNLGFVLLHQGQFESALQSFDRAIQLNPSLAEAQMNRGDVLRELKRPALAIDAYSEAIRLNPKLHKALNNLSVVHSARGQFEQAADAARRAIALRPDYFEAFDNLGIALQGQQSYADAEAAHSKAIQLEPDHASAHSNLGMALLHTATIDDAIRAHRSALSIDPQLVGAHVNLGNALKDAGQLDAAIESWRAAIAIDPTNPQPWNNLLYTLPFHPGFDSRAIAVEQRRWSEQLVEPLKKQIQPHLNDRNPDRKLRIGYVSPDFYAQAECFFVLPLLESHDHDQFEVHCYSSVAKPDQITARLKLAADVWHEVQHLSDAELAEQIRADRIDILVDLTMHMTASRLLCFARKPAPIQVSWLAYPGSTGLKAIDYRLTDSFMDPTGEDISWSAEEPIRLPDCWCCYQPVDEMPDVSPLPAERNGAITFGSFNNFCKVNRDVLELWSRVLVAIPDSTLQLLCPEGSHRQKLIEQMQSLGVQPGRVNLIKRLPRAEYLAMHHRIDLALDTFPYNGITTTCDALWMGVPVLTLPGRTPASRAGLGLLRTAGLGEFVAETSDQFVQLAVELSNDLGRVAKIRTELRSRVQNSPLTDGVRFARNVENVLREKWRNYVFKQD